MSITFRWGIIAFVATMTSFTAYYTQFNPKEPYSATIYLAIGIFLFTACIFFSIFFTRRALGNAFTVKDGLQEGMKTALIVITLFSIYNYFYLNSINTNVIQRLIEAQVDHINASTLTDADKQMRMDILKAEITPFKKVTQDVLRLLAIASMTSLFSTIINKKFPI